jgi:hypothetical protein
MKETPTMTFSQDNTTGYTDAELAALNDELAARLAAVDPDDIEARQQIEKAFADAVSGRAV